MNLTATALAKLTIQAYRDQSFEPRALEKTWVALLNPTELSFSSKNRYEEVKAVEGSQPQQVFAGGEGDQVQIDLLLDGTGVVGESGPIGDRLDELLTLTAYQGEVHQPYFVDVRWGRFRIRGVLTQADVTYKLFDRNGEPLRATVKLSIKGALSPKEVAAEERRSSPDLYQTWLVRDGDTIDAIAAEVYGDPAFWRPVAAANRLANPRGLRTGQLLMLPPLERAR